MKARTVSGTILRGKDCIYQGLRKTQKEEANSQVQGNYGRFDIHIKLFFKNKDCLFLKGCEEIRNASSMNYSHVSRMKTRGEVQHTTPRSP